MSDTLPVYAYTDTNAHLFMNVEFVYTYYILISGELAASNLRCYFDMRKLRLQANAQVWKS